MKKNWKELEAHVRAIAELKWNAKCRPEHIEGVDVDGVVHISNDEVVLIEITKERNLEKVRSDLNKLFPLKLSLATKGITCRCYVILEESPTNSMTEAGQAQHIPVISASHFERDFFDFEAYDSLRKQSTFGSAVDSKTGENDKRKFISVKYEEQGRDNNFTIEGIVNKLLRSSKVVLTGDFGTGKSRCIKEVYESITEKIKEAGAFPLAINLRDHWSSSNALEIIAGHLGNIGLSNSIDNVVRLLNSGHLVLLLDGFDEIGTQSHDTRIVDRRALRKHAVRGLRDLIARSKAGILVTGRSHFFDSDEEMLDSLGIPTDKGDLVLLGIPDSFTVPEGKAYLTELGITANLPDWLPRKPLVFQVIAELEKTDITKILTLEFGEFQFWAAFINAICVRESKGVSNSISPLTIRHILLDLAAKSRHSDSYLGRLSPKDIDESYERAVRTAPDETGRQLLSRMCTLGRIEPESPDRQFIEDSIVEVLRAESLIAELVSMSNHDTVTQWRQSLRTAGIFHGAAIIDTNDLDQFCFSYLRKFESIGNTNRLAEIISMLTFLGTDSLDFKNLNISKCEIPILNLIGRRISNLSIESSIIHTLVLDHCPITVEDNFQIRDSLISMVAGISDQSGLPPWIGNTEVVDFERVSNASRIKESPLNPNQKLFLSIVHKIFFQPGAGREESSLLKGGYGQRYSPKLVDSIIRIMHREGLIEKFKGDDGWVYKPVRRHTERMAKIRSELTLSEDSMWREIGTLRN